MNKRDVSKKFSNSRTSSKSSKNKYSRSKGKNDKNERRTMDTTGSNEFKSNPIEWYNKYPHLLESVGRIPFPYRPGIPLPIGYNNTNSKVYKMQIPSVMKITYAPTIGKSNDNQSPISQVAKELYGRVRAAFSSELVVDAPDLVMYLLALDSIFSNIAFLKRVYRIVNSYTPENYDIPDMLLSACGFTTAQIKDLRINWIQGWSLINSLILMTRKFKCPAVMDVFNRHYWMNDNVYTDAPSINSQMYIFVPSVFYTFEEVASENGTSLSVSEFKDDFIGSWTDMYSAVLGQIEALAASSDAYTISGYLKRAFDGVGDFVIDEIEQMPAFTPTYDAVVLMQIENSRTLPVTHTTLEITQDVTTNAILCNPRIMTSGAINLGYYGTHELLNLRTDNPQVPEVIEATRLMPVMSNPFTMGEVQGVRDVFSATEIPEFYTMYARGLTGSVVESMSFNTYGFILTTPTQGNQLNQFIFWMGQMSKFDWHPLIFINPYPNNQDGVASYWDYYNVTSVDQASVINMHRVCLYSEFNAFSII